MKRQVRHILIAGLLSVANLFSSTALFSQNTDDGKIIERTKYNFAVFEKIDGPEKSYSKQEYDNAVGDSRFEMERLKYQSDGLQVVAYIYRPRETGDKKYPVIIFNRGSYVRGDIGSLLVPSFRRLAQEGFVVLAPLYRASDGAAGKDEVGGGDLNDLLNVVPLLRSIKYADSENLFLYGESRGGMMTFQAIRDGFPARAAATFGAFTDFNGLVTAHAQLYEPLIKAIWSDFEARKDEIAKRRSAIAWPDKINVPLFLMHGGKDGSVDPQQTLDFAKALQKLNKPYELHIYGGDNHVLATNQKDRDARVAAWFKKFLKVK
jgi:dipeptidyl aminopeptidase/acylaminoacyl peptidase